MSVIIPLLLLCFFTLSFWLLAESRVNKVLKGLVISTFCLFTVVMFITYPTFMGWGAKPSSMPEVITIDKVTIMEPSIKGERPGGIWITIIQPTIEYHEPILGWFGHNVVHSQPRMFAFPYSKSLDEALTNGGERSVMSRTQRGTRVRGRLSKMGKQGKGKGGEKGNGKGKGSNKGKGSKSNGGGSHSQEQEWKFYDLKPSYFQRKD